MFKGNSFPYQKETGRGLRSSDQKVYKRSPLLPWETDAMQSMVSYFVWAKEKLNTSQKHTQSDIKPYPVAMTGQSVLVLYTENKHIYCH